MSAVRPIPEGFHAVTPYLILQGAAQAIDFYEQTLGAVELLRMPGNTPGSIGHAEIKIGDSIVMLADEHPEMGYRGPKSIGGTAVSLMVYVVDVDAVAQKMVAAGAKELRPVQNQFYGDRSGTFEDPFGHVWTISTHVEDLSPEEISRRAAASMG